MTASRRTRSPRRKLFLEALEDRQTPATFIVNTLADNGTGFGPTGDLRYCIDQANANPGADTITFQSGLTGTITLTNGKLEIDGATTINGPGAGNLTITSNGSRAFSTIGAPANTQITISGMTISGITLSASGDGGSAFLVSDERLTLNGITVQNTKSTNSLGGAILVTGSGILSVSNSTFANNSSGFGGAIGTAGSGCTVFLTNCTLTGNTTTGGGAASGYGGAVNFEGSSGGAGLTIRNCTIVGNSGAIGGGIRHNSSLPISIESSIVSGNTAGSAPDLTSISAVTAKFSAIGNANGFTLSGTSGNNLAFGTPLLLNILGNYGGTTRTISLLPGSPAIDAGSSTLTQDQRGKAYVGTPDIGAFESQGFILTVQSGSGQTTTATTAFASPLVVAVTAKNSIEPVKNGNVTFTGPGSGPSTSPASKTVPINSGGIADSGILIANSNVGSYSLAALAAGATPVTFALNHTEAPSFVVNTNADSVNNSDGLTSLREAIAYANTKTGTDTISFNPTFFATTRTIALTAGELAINDSVSIAGPGAGLLTVSGNNASRSFNTTAGTSATQVSISGMTISNGFATGGGAILVGDEQLSLNGVAVQNNNASGSDGGGVFVNAAGKLTALNSTFANNSSQFGGAVAFFASGGTLSLTNCTLTGNTASSAGGATYFRGNSGSGVTIRNSTIVGNSAGSQGGGIWQWSTLPISIQSSIVSGNTAATGSDIRSYGSNYTANVNFSAIGNNSGFVLSGTSGNNLPFQPHANLKLGALASNGGPTQTILPAVDSPIRDKGSNPASLSTDQRGKPRTSNAVADIGAVELDPRFIVRNTNDAGVDSLRQQVLDANAIAGSNTVTFDPTVFNTARTITLTTGELAITDSVTINGPGAGLLTVSGNNASRIFNTDPAPTGALIAITGMTISGGKASIGGGGIYVDEEDLTLNAVIMQNNSTIGLHGGGIYVIGAGKLTVSNSLFTNNSAAGFGGAISFHNLAGGTLLLTNSTVTGNTAASLGGALYFGPGSGGSGVNIRNSTIVGNSAGTSGGGINRFSPLAFNLESSIISGNTAGSNPQDIAATGSPITANFSAIGSGSGFTLSGASGKNLPYGSPLLLGPLGSYGGSTQTIPLLPGSPAINAGSNPALLAIDQRGMPRSVGVTDIGSFEVQPEVSSLSVNGGTGQRSRITSITVTLDSSLDVTLFQNPGAVTLTRTLATSTGSIGAIVTIGSGLVVTPGTGTSTSLTLTFQNIVNAGVESGSLADGRWQLSIPSLGYQSSLGDTALRRLFGDADNNGSVDGTDFAAFGSSFGTSGADNPFDFDNNFTIDGTDFAAFGARFGITL